MAPHTIHPETLEERVIWHAITWTWGYYVVGGLYLLAPVIAWLLTFWIFVKLAYEGPHTPPAERVRVTISVWLWIGGMLVMELALIMGHMSYELGAGQLIKSSVGWAKGWALLALFPLIGCALQIRAAVVYRAAGWLALQTLCLLPLMIVAPHVGLPGRLYISPLLMLGGPGPEYFEVQLYGRDIMTGAARWRFWAPWAPAAGLIANVYLVFALYERSLPWKSIGLAAGLAMCFLSQSRLALVSLAVVSVAVWGLSRLTRPYVIGAAAAALLMAALSIDALLDAAEEAEARFKGARSESSRVRSALGRIAMQRWRDEAPVWGHGVVERGPHLVEYMPIGSHHSWYGLLFVKGAVGFFALLVPVLASTLEMLLKSQTSRTARCGLAMMLIMILYSFGENLEVLVYLFWPALVVVGCASRQRYFTPWGRPLSGSTSLATPCYSHTP